MPGRLPGRTAEEEPRIHRHRRSCRARRGTSTIPTVRIRTRCSRARCWARRHRMRSCCSTATIFRAGCSAGAAPTAARITDAEVEGGRRLLRVRAGHGFADHARKVRRRATAHRVDGAARTIKGQDQDRGNSGVLLMDRYEIQVLESSGGLTYADGQAGALYGQWPPLVNPIRPQGEWQAYDIVFEAPRFEGEKLVRQRLRHGVLQRSAGASPQGDSGHDGAPRGGQIQSARGAKSRSRCRITGTRCGTGIRGSGGCKGTISRSRVDRAIGAGAIIFE